MIFLTGKKLFILERNATRWFIAASQIFSLHFAYPKQTKGGKKGISKYKTNIFKEIVISLETDYYHSFSNMHFFPPFVCFRWADVNRMSKTKETFFKDVIGWDVMITLENREASSLAWLFPKGRKQPQTRCKMLICSMKRWFIKLLTETGWLFPPFAWLINTQLQFLTGRQACESAFSLS